MDLLKSIAVAASGLRSQSGRMRVIAENLANADSGPASAGADPYRRKIPTFQQRFDRELEAQVVPLGQRLDEPEDVDTGAGGLGGDRRDVDRDAQGHDRAAS